MASKSSKLHLLNPFVGKDGLIRVGTRILYADVDDQAKYPVILPRDDGNVKALVRAFHVNERHSGPKHVLTQLRQTVWILQGLQACKTVVNHCVKCQRAFKKPLEQKMAPLPASRVTSGAPFEETGLDLFGPLPCKMNGRATHKVWVTAFTCLKTRSVHAEIVFKLDADSLVNAICRFVARRPGARSFISDNGTNLVAADRILKEQLQEWNVSSSRDLQRKGLTWTFIPPRAPHRGGVWERVVGLFKRHIAAQSILDPLHIDTLSTLIVEIESIINRRPLTAISTDPRDCEPLTPAHFLYPSVVAHSSATIVPTASLDVSEGHRASWRRVQARVNSFWNVWKKEYISTLHERKKWTTTKRDLQVDDLVILVDENTYRGEWKLARVTDPKTDGEHCRSAEVRTADGKTFLRDRTKLVLLELDHNPVAQ